MTSSEDKDREVWRRYWTFWYEQRQQEADAAKRLAEEYGETFPASSCAATDPLLPGLLEAERILRMIGYDEEDFAMQRLLAHIAPRRVTVEQLAKASALPESGPINAAGQEVETGGVSSHGPGPQAVTDEESTVPAPAAPSKAPTPRTDAALEKPTFEAYGRLADLARQLERELAEKDARLAGIIFSGSLDEVKCGDLQRWRNEFKAKQSASSASAEPVCCQKYATCLQPCTPRGRWQAEQEFALSATEAHTDHPARVYDRTCPACNSGSDR